ncbi:hypothetical protein L593_09205 [Salinarchaeum sp. Harcht-Bsk1]|uniref:lysylphosphatidylglycerol synthase transmembrane domain-containing protein n=1 Tax=Salinarchaeum sp. Harcht-Bsk1 TaxID=1333523 RepID=UPI0003423571|nr:lysylphosphatidylglycerol synthase transmembrane domain-containing protein [Salinarchaeum sp. Harcht-Bsk1]AGN01786.1 hypothetical protein L593_09205 [Salinarchaeum sp. Harcht-Bsk1]
MQAQPAPEPEPSEPGSSRRRLPILGTIAVLVLGGLVAARTVDLGEAVDAIRAADPLLLAAAILVYALSWPLRGRRYGDVLAPMDRRLRTGFLTSAVLLSQTANLAIPARGGDAVRAVVLKRRRAVAYATGVASLAVERAFDLLAIGALGGVALAWLVLAGDAAPVFDGLRSLDLPVALFSGAAAGIGLLLAAGAVLAYRSSSAALDLLPDRLRDGVATAASNLAVLVRRPRALAAVGLGSVAIWALDAVTAVLVLAAVANPDPLALLAVGTLAVCAGNLAKVLPLTQGGVGLYEGAFAATVVALSPIAGSLALAAALLDHALKNGVTLAGGALAGLVLHRSSASETGDSTRTGNLLGWPKR